MRTLQMEIGDAAAFETRAANHSQFGGWLL